MKPNIGENRSKMSQNRSEIEQKWGPGLFQAPESDFSLFFDVFLLFFFENSRPTDLFCVFNVFLVPERGPNSNQNRYKNKQNLHRFLESLLEIVLERFGS
jgi:hypothetical protein